jgi:hypothetical protein
MYQYGDNLYLTTTRHPSTTVANNNDAVYHPADMQNQGTGSDINDQGFPTRQNSIVNDTINDSSTYQIGEIYDLSYCIEDDKVTPYSGGGDDVRNNAWTGMNGDRDFAVTAAPLNRFDSISSNSQDLSDDIGRTYDHAQASREASSATSILVLCNPKQPSAHAGPRSARARPFTPGVMNQEGEQGRQNLSRPNTAPTATELRNAWPPLTVFTTMLHDHDPASPDFSTTWPVEAL